MEKPQVTPSSLKIGYVDVGYILDNLPEAKKNSTEIQSFEKQLNNQIKTKFDEYQVKTEAFQQQVDTLTEAQKKQKIIEIQDLGRVIQGLEDRKPAQMAEKYKAVMQPLHDKMQEVIKEVAEKHAYTFVLNKNTDAGPVVLFAQKSLDLSELVLEKLKAMAPKEVQPPLVGSKAPFPAKAAPTKKSVKNK
ncbi:OmpH family outer membrane protein [Cardinium endosymbiont of Oedothorax gibbosus]|uniref:OmpH family outer membrane protein n=1 Tax=Cardinium endosymbiont of Oedothorax gibbosus TaxID=931101 RepID=UPI00202589E9|nr:OmpH family outer membrane protein [Cardinium endosymbiont of Oedothorax gibbosus]